MNIQFLIIKKKILSRLSRIFKFINPDSVIEKFLDKNFSGIAKKYQNFTGNSESEKNQKKIIWIFWWQGYENAPVLVKKCLDSIKTHANGAETVLITKENFSKYTNFPPFILEKLNSKKITLTHFSDILRMDLLSKHGGLWLDATIFVSRDIPPEYFSMPYFSIHYKTSTSKIARGRWTGFCQGAKQGSLIHSFCNDVFLSYWEKYDKLIDYFLIDYVMDFGYKNIPEFKNLVDSLPFNNEGVKKLDSRFNDIYSKEQLDSILSESVFFKLNWKREYKLENNGKPTFYAKFMEQA